MVSDHCYYHTFGSASFSAVFTCDRCSRAGNHWFFWRERIVSGGWAGLTNWSKRQWWVYSNDATHHSNNYYKNNLRMSVRWCVIGGLETAQRSLKPVAWELIRISRPFEYHDQSMFANHKRDNQWIGIVNLVNHGLNAQTWYPIDNQPISIDPSSVGAKHAMCSRVLVFDGIMFSKETTEASPWASDKTHGNSIPRPILTRVPPATCQQRSLGAPNFTIWRIPKDPVSSSATKEVKSSHTKGDTFRSWFFTE